MCILCLNALINVVLGLLNIKLKVFSVIDIIITCQTKICFVFQGKLCNNSDVDFESSKDGN